MNIQKIAAFSSGDVGGNPAGVVIDDQLPPPKIMQQIATEIGYSETAFVAPDGEDWMVRYYALEGEVAFCGHATIALGVALANEVGQEHYHLNLRDGSIDVSAIKDPEGWQAELASPVTWSKPLDATLQYQILALFDLRPTDLDPRFAPTLGFAGNRHPIIAVHSREVLAQMSYDFDAGRRLMKAEDLTTISLIYFEDDFVIHARNAFAFGGVVEDPATGAAAAALGGALVDQNWGGLSEGGQFELYQGVDMGSPSRLNVRVSGRPGDSVHVSGTARFIEG
ncbi:MAG: PhzF family phenazine biosynthesis protein [Pseudoruegeria sp.]